jgi:glutathione S-transferase
MLDASLSRRMETIRPASEQSSMWIARQIMAINAALDWLEARIQLLDGPIDIGQIAIGCALGYLDLRFPGEPWLKERTRIANWNTVFQERPSMVATRYEVLKGTLPAHLVKEGPSRH